jgi:DNA-binding FadR family transcriptional regulator
MSSVYANCSRPCERVERPDYRQKPHWRRSSICRAPAIEASVSPQHIFEARLAVEPPTARLAAVRGTPAQLTEIKSCLDAMAKQDVYDEWKRLDDKLHTVISNAAGNPVFAAVISALQTMTNNHLDARSKALFGAGRFAVVNAEHARFVDAILRRDPEAAEAAMHEHIASVERHLIRSENSRDVA